MIQRITYLDQFSRTSAPVYPVVDDAAAAGWVGALVGWTTANMAGYRITRVVATNTGTYDGDYQDVSQVAELVFASNVTPGILTVHIPAPVTAMFRPDGETVDPVAADSLIVNAINYLTLPSGAAITTYLRGTRRYIPRCR